MIVKSTISGTIIVALLILSAIIIYTPIANIVFLLPILGVLFATLLLSNNSRCYHKHSRLLFFFCFYLLICILYMFLGVSSATPGAIFTHIVFFFFILLMISLPYIITIKQSKIIYYSTIFVVLFNVLDNIRLGLENPEIYSLVNRTDISMEAGLNIGGVGFYNSIFFFFTICLFGYLNSEKKKMKYIMLVCVVFSAIYIFAFCLKAAIIVFSLLSVFLLYFAKRAINISTFCLRILIPAIMVFGLVNIFSDFIIEIISKLFTSDRLAQRLLYLVSSESSSIGANTVEAREYLWMLSIDTWTDSFTNFLFGIGDHRADWSAGDTAEKIGIGQHSEFFDTFARYGIIGVFVLFHLFYLSFKYLLYLFGKRYKIQLLVIMLIFVLFSVTRLTFQPGVGFALFIILPLMANFLNSCNNYKV